MKKNKKIILDWAKVSTEKEAYSALFSQLKAPSWHGTNLDALWDSIANGDINEIEPPFTLVIRNERLINEHETEFGNKIRSLFIEASKKRNGIEFESDNGA